MATEEADDLRREHMRVEVDDGEHERVDRHTEGLRTCGVAGWSAVVSTCMRDRHTEGLRTGQPRAGMQIGIRVTFKHMQ